MPLTPKESSTATSSLPIFLLPSANGYRLGIVRVEEKEINGERWSRAYNQAGELVEARVIE